MNMTDLIVRRCLMSCFIECMESSEKIRTLSWRTAKTTLKRTAVIRSDSETMLNFEYAFYLGKGLSINVFDMANKMSHMWY